MILRGTLFFLFIFLSGCRFGQGTDKSLFNDRFSAGLSDLSPQLLPQPTVTPPAPARPPEVPIVYTQPDSFEDYWSGKSPNAALPLQIRITEKFDIDPARTNFTYPLKEANYFYAYKCTSSGLFQHTKALIDAITFSQTGAAFSGDYLAYCNAHKEDLGPDKGFAPHAVFFEGGWISDPENLNKRYIWDFGDGSPPFEGYNAAHIFQNPKPQGYTVRLAVLSGQEYKTIQTKVQVFSRPGTKYFVDSELGNDFFSGKAEAPAAGCISPKASAESGTPCGGPWKSATRAFRVLSPRKDSRTGKNNPLLYCKRDANDNPLLNLVTVYKRIVNDPADPNDDSDVGSYFTKYQGVELTDQNYNTGGYASKFQRHQVYLCEGPDPKITTDDNQAPSTSGWSIYKPGDQILFKRGKKPYELLAGTLTMKASTRTINQVGYAYSSLSCRSFITMGHYSAPIGILIGATGAGATPVVQYSRTKSIKTLVESEGISDPDGFGSLEYPVINRLTKPGSNTPYAYTSEKPPSGCGQIVINDVGIGLAHFTLQDLEISLTTPETPSETTNFYQSTAAVTGFLATRLKVKNYNQAFVFSGNFQTSSNGVIAAATNNIFLIGNTFINSSNIAIYSIGAERYALIDNYFNYAGNHHNYQHFGTGIVSGNLIARPAFGRTALRLIGEPTNYRRYNHVINNHFAGWLDFRNGDQYMCNGFFPCSTRSGTSPFVAHPTNPPRYNFQLLGFTTNTPGGKTFADHMLVQRNLVTDSEVFAGLGDYEHLMVRDNDFLTGDLSDAKNGNGRIWLGSNTGWDRRPLFDIDFFHNRFADLGKAWNIFKIYLYPGPEFEGRTRPSYLSSTDNTIESKAGVAFNLVSNPYPGTADLNFTDKIQNTIDLTTRGTLKLSCTSPGEVASFAFVKNPLGLWGENRAELDPWRGGGHSVTMSSHSAQTWGLASTDLKVDTVYVQVNSHPIYRDFFGFNTIWVDTSLVPNKTVKKGFLLDSQFVFIKKSDFRAASSGSKTSGIPVYTFSAFPTAALPTGGDLKVFDCSLQGP